jgi:hypothetical protein
MTAAGTAIGKGYVSPLGLSYLSQAGGFLPQRPAAIGKEQVHPFPCPSHPFLKSSELRGREKY